MAVASRGAALSALRALLGQETAPARTLLQRPYLPDGMDPSIGPTRMDPTTQIGGYGNEARYRLHDRPDLAQAIAGSPADVLSGTPMVGSEVVDAYVKSSIDLTMQGGTTSGVVYPLAVCELATDFRFRNVGGASAGAIAAAITAAAELGRSEQARHPRPSAGPPVPPPAAAGTADRPPSIRRGFVGLTDIISWLTQTRPVDTETDEFRLAQLFRPDAANRGLFRVLIATMQQRTWTLPLLMLMAFGWVTRIIAGAVIVGTVLVTGWVGARYTRAVRPWYVSVGWGLLDSTAFLSTVIALVLLLQGLGTVIRGSALTGSNSLPAWVTRLRGATSSYATPPSKTARQLILGLVFLALAITVAVLRPLSYAAALTVGLAGSLIVIITVVASGLGYLLHFRSRSFGLIPGTTPPQATRNPLDLLAGVPKPTVEQSVVPWLNDCLSQLAGLPPGEVLRFGHLWSGADFHLDRSKATPELLATWRLMSVRPDHRLVNLELMTTDLTRRRPYRFPLAMVRREDPAKLWLCLDQLKDGDSQFFPEAVMGALSDGEPRQVRDRSGTLRTLHPMPEPWDLPVIFAVRLSMALPGLFKAVRMYRIVQSTPVQDDFGRAILDSGQPLAWPESDHLAEELWFSDGGITSNFPVHFFDAPLPRWPTVSLNLGQYPETAPHQDVWLPQDFDVDNIPVQPLTNSGLSLAGAVFGTAMAWRDNMQSSMPGYRNRIAQVRTRSNEGGANLFMPREVIASMALRGALAGARLRTRFADTSQWNRFRWLRLRVAVSNLESLRRSTQERRGFYRDTFSGPQWLADQRDTFSDKPSGTDVPWYDPLDRFWPEAPRMLNTFADAYRAPADSAENVMTTKVPLPEPELRQIPQE